MSSSCSADFDGFVWRYSWGGNFLHMVKQAPFAGAKSSRMSSDFLTRQSLGWTDWQTHQVCWTSNSIFELRLKKKIRPFCLRCSDMFKRKTTERPYMQHIFFCCCWTYRLTVSIFCILVELSRCCRNFTRKTSYTWGGPQNEELK